MFVVCFSRSPRISLPVTHAHGLLSQSNASVLVDNKQKATTPECHGFAVYGGVVPRVPGTAGVKPSICFEILTIRPQRVSPVACRR